mmetsp:Transcript_933/g.2589  ORF Transcript_933/g.2589 Transcript_933/m.2589 type:complete len:200 (+) Transcript_933:307-906(+)
MHLSRVARAQALRRRPPLSPVCQPEAAQRRAQALLPLWGRVCARGLQHQLCLPPGAPRAVLRPPRTRLVLLPPRPASRLRAECPRAPAVVPKLQGRPPVLPAPRSPGLPSHHLVRPLLHPRHRFPRRLPSRSASLPARTLLGLLSFLSCARRPACPSPPAPPARRQWQLAPRLGAARWMPVGWQLGLPCPRARGASAPC